MVDRDIGGLAGVRYEPLQHRPRQVVKPRQVEDLEQRLALLHRLVPRGPVVLLKGTAPPQPGENHPHTPLHLGGRVAAAFDGGPQENVHPLLDLLPAAILLPRQALAPRFVPGLAPHRGPFLQRAGQLPRNSARDRPHRQVEQLEHPLRVRRRPPRLKDQREHPGQQVLVR